MYETLHNCTSQCRVTRQRYHRWPCRCTLCLSDTHITFPQFCLCTASSCNWEADMLSLDLSRHMDPFFSRPVNFRSYNEPYATPSSLLAPFFLSFGFTPKSLPPWCLFCQILSFKPYPWTSIEPIKEGFNINKWGMHSSDDTGAGCQYNWMSVIPLQWETCMPIETVGYV